MIRLYDAIMCEVMIRLDDVILCEVMIRLDDVIMCKAMILFYGNMILCDTTSDEYVWW